MSKPHIESRQQYIFQAYKAKADAARTFTELVADWMTASFGTVLFLAVNSAFFFLWLLINSGFVPGIAIVDPFPFGLLTTMVSLEAIFLAIVVLISQNRAERVAEIREEVDLQINMIAEEEITKVLNLLKLSLEKQGIKLSEDEELQYMLRPVSSSELAEVIEGQI